MIYFQNEFFQAIILKFQSQLISMTFFTKSSNMTFTRFYFCAHIASSWKQRRVEVSTVIISLTCARWHSHYVLVIWGHYLHSGVTKMLCTRWHYLALSSVLCYNMRPLTGEGVTQSTHFAYMQQADIRFKLSIQFKSLQNFLYTLSK